MPYFGGWRIGENGREVPHAAVPYLMTVASFGLNICAMNFCVIPSPLKCSVVLICDFAGAKKNSSVLIRIFRSVFVGVPSIAFFCVSTWWVVKFCITVFHKPLFFFNVYINLLVVVLKMNFKIFAKFHVTPNLVIVSITRSLRIGQTDFYKLKVKEYSNAELCLQWIFFSF